MERTPKEERLCGAFLELGRVALAKGSDLGIQRLPIRAKTRRMLISERTDLSAGSGAEDKGARVDTKCRGGMREGSLRCPRRRKTRRPHFAPLSYLPENLPG